MEYWLKHEQITWPAVKFVLAGSVLIFIIRMILCGSVHPMLENLPSVFKLVARRLGVKDHKTQLKLAENMWYTCWHTLSFTTTMGILLHVHEPWLGRVLFNYETGLMFKDSQVMVLTVEQQIYLMIELSFWLSCVYMVLLETKRKDTLQMICHHFVTLTLIGFASFLHFIRSGPLTLAVHDCGDILLYLTKCIHYLRLDSLANACFAVFAVVFFVTRLIILPVYILQSTAFDWPKYVTGSYWGSLFHWPATIGLACLICLHILWFKQIVRMVVMAVQAGNVKQDIRSDDEEECETNNKVKAN